MGVYAESRTVKIGLLSVEPLRMEGFTRVFEESSRPGSAHLAAVTGSMDELLHCDEIAHIVVDLNSVPGGLATLATIRARRPDIRLIVIGPESHEEMIEESIIAGARAYIGTSAGPAIVRKAIDEVLEGSIWAPRRVLSRLIDRLLSDPRRGSSRAVPHLTARERQVLELILSAKSNREIAVQLGIEERTAKAHVGRLMRKTGAENRIGLSLRAMEFELVPGYGRQEWPHFEGAESAPELMTIE